MIKPTRYESDESDTDNHTSREKPVKTHSKITSEKLPSISMNKTKPKLSSDDDEDNRNYLSPKNSFNKKKKSYRWR